MHSPKCVIALEQERCGLNPCSGLSTLCSSTKSEARMYKHDVQVCRVRKQVQWVGS